MPCRHRIFENREGLLGGDQNREHILVDGPGEIESYVVGDFQWPDRGQTQTDTIASNEVNGFSVTDSFLNQSHWLSPQCVLQTITNESGRVLLDRDKYFPNSTKYVNYTFDDRRIAITSLDDFNDRHEMRKSLP